MSADTASQIAPTVRESFWKRRVVTPLIAQLKQGVTPEKLALTVALGLVLGIFPILGATTLLCGAAAIALRLKLGASRGTLSTTASAAVSDASPQLRRCGRSWHSTIPAKVLAPLTARARSC